MRLLIPIATFVAYLDSNEVVGRFRGRLRDETIVCKFVSTDNRFQDWSLGSMSFNCSSES